MERPALNDRYEPLESLGEGAFGEVFKAKDRRDHKFVAIKRIKLGESKSTGISWTALREINFLQEIKHENILALLDVFVHEGEVHLVFEFMVTDLEKIIRESPRDIGPAEVKRFMIMLLEGIKNCHENWILHRDLKPSNLLISPDGVLKLADFGLARMYGSPDPKYTTNVVTRWYRAPELLFGTVNYGSGVDMWAVGCIFAELLALKPLFPASNEFDQLTQIFQLLGTPTEAIWPGMTKLPNYLEFSNFPAQSLHAHFITATANAIDLLSKFLVYDPNARISATDALNHPYFSEPPFPTTCVDIAKIISQTKKQTQTQRPQPSQSRFVANGSPLPQQPSFSTPT